jgi:hypothetical protein
MITKPNQMPMIPAIPAKVGGAGKGNLRNVNNAPTHHTVDRL